MGYRERATDLRLGRALAGKPVLLHPDKYEQWLRGSFEDLLAFQKRCFRDDLIEMQPTSELLMKMKAPDSSEAPPLL
jgi:hypothetical protein